ncbi:MAG: site-specific integrase [Actinomycetota bacterium]|nr:site-specific integrase [Actinomycetota bacterium]
MAPESLGPQLLLTLPSADGLVERFLGRQKPATRQAYTQDLADFAAFLGTDSTAAVLQLLAGGPGLANQLVHDYLVQLRQKGLASATINRRLSALRSLVRLARLFQLISWTLELPGEKLERYRDTRGPGLGGMRRLLAALEERQDAKGARDRALLRLAFDLGLRRGELVSLNLEHLDLEAATLAVLGKGQEGRDQLRLPTETAAVMQAWLEQRGLEPGPLFVNFDRAGKRAAAELDLDLPDRARAWRAGPGQGPAPRGQACGDHGGAGPLSGGRAGGG